AWEITQRTPARNVRPGQDDLVDLPVAEQVGRVGRRHPGLAGAGGSQHDHLRTAPRRVEVSSLRRIQRPNRRQSALLLELRAAKADDLSRIEAAKLTTLFLAEVLLAVVLTQGGLLLSDPDEESWRIA